MWLDALALIGQETCALGSNGRWNLTGNTPTYCQNDAEAGEAIVVANG